MNLKPGKKYLVDGTKEKIVKRDQGDKGKVEDTQSRHMYYQPRIDYVQNAEEDESNAGYPKSQFTTRKPKDTETTVVEFSATINSVVQYNHDQIPFFGANRVTYEDIKYNEVYQTIANDEIYQISSNAQIKYNSVTYNHGDVIYANQGTSFETVRGNPLFIPIAPGIGFEPPQNVEPTQDDYYLVYGTSEAAYLNGLKYNGTTYYPGDMLLGLDNVNQYQTHLNNAYVDWPNAGHFTNGVFDGAAVAIQLNVLNNPNLKGYSTLADALSDENNDYDHFLVYGYANAFYNGYSLRPEILLKNIFKTGTDTDFEWDDKTTGRKFPIIREVVKSDSILRGVEYYVARDRKINTEESQIKYDGAFVSTKTNEIDGTPAGISFVGKNQVSNYSTPSKEVSITNDTKDTESSANLSPYAENLDRYSGIPFVIKKEPIGLRKGQDYILVPGEVTSIEEVLYRVRGAGSIEYPVDSDIILYNGECFKGVAGKEEFDTTGVVSVFPVINQITLEGAPTGTKISINGAAEVTYSSSLLVTSYNQRGLKFKITTCAYPLLYWDTHTGSPQVYPAVTSLNDHSSIHVHAAGSGSVLFPKKNLYYLCDGLGLNTSDFGRKTKVEIEAESEDDETSTFACIEAGGEWVPQRVAHDLATRSYYDLDSFDISGGSCSIALYNKGQSACEANGGTWKKNNSADVFNDQLFTYVTEIDSVEQAYPFTVTATNSAHGSDGSPQNEAAANQIEVTALAHPLKVDDCVFFDADSNENYPLFVVGEDYEVGATTIDGRLLYGDIVSGSVGTVGIKPSTDNTNPYEHYYVEDLEVETDGNASVGEDVTVAVNAIPVGISLGTLLKFKNSSDVFSGELKLTEEAASGSVSLTGSLRAGDLASGDKAKISASEVGNLAINSEFSHKSRFKGIPNFNVIRAYNYKALGSDLPDADTQASINAYLSTKVYDVLQTTDVLANEIAYRVGGTGYIKYNGTIYHGEARGRVVVNHEANINEELAGADSDDLENKNAYYQGSSTIRVRSLASHIPAGTEIVFPNGVFRLSKNADARDTIITGEILADYMENFIYSTIWHNDESFYYKVEGSSITGVGGSFTKVNKDEKTTTNDDVFVHNSAAIEWVDGEELDLENPPHTNRKIIKITGSERKEYFVEVTPTVAAKDYLVENKKYDVQADGSFVEINRQLTNGEIEQGSSFVVGGNLYKVGEKELNGTKGLEFKDTAEPQRKGNVPEFIIYNRKPYIPGEVFDAVEGETNWLEVTIKGTPTETGIDSGIWKVPIEALTAALPLAPALRGEDDVVWTPEADLNDNELVPLFGYWDETEKEWVDKEIFSAENLTEEGKKVYGPLKLRFGNHAVGVVLAPSSSIENKFYDGENKFYKKGCTEIYLKNSSSVSFRDEELGKTGSGTDNSSKVFGGYAASDSVTMTVKSLPHDLPAGTELVFYPSHPFRQFRTLVEEEKLYEKQYPHDWWSAQSGARRFILSENADAEATEIKGELKATYNSNVSTFEGVGFKARAEIFREIIYNDKVVRAGESFTCAKDVKDLSNERKAALIKTWKDSQNSKLGIKNSTGVEKVVSYDNFIDYYEERPIFSGKSFNLEQGLGSYKYSGTSDAADINFGDITGSQTRFSEDFGMFFFVPQFGLINKTVDSAKIYKVNKTSEKAYSHLFDNTPVSSYDQAVAVDSDDNNLNTKIKVGGNGVGYISYNSGTKNIRETLNLTLDKDITFNPSSPAMYQKMPTGFEANRFYLLGVEDLASDTHDPTTLYQKLKYNLKRYFPFINDASIGDPAYGTFHNYSDLSLGENKLHPPYVQSYIFGRSFAPLLENRLANNKLDKIKLLKLSGSGWSDDTTIIKTARYFSLINSTFIYYTILFKKKFNNQWSNWEIAERQVEATVEKLTNGQPTKIRIYDSTDISSEVQDLRYTVATSSDSYYNANYPHLVNVIEEKYPVLVNGMEDQRLYTVKEGPIIYAEYGGTTEGNDIGFVRCNEGVPVSGSYAQHKFFYGKTDAWVSDGASRLETMDHEGVFNPTDFDPASTSFGNFDEIMVKPDSAATAGSIYSVATCYDPWEIQPHRVYEVAGHANDRIEYNGRIYEPDDFITGKSLNAPNSLVAASVVRHSMTATEYEVMRQASIQPWMLSNEGVYSKEVGYKKLTPLLYKNHGGTNVTLEANKRYILHNSSPVIEGSYNAMDQMIPSNEFIGGSSANYTSNGSPVVMQKFEDGQTILPGVEYFVYGQGKVTYPTEVRTTAAVNASNTPVSVAVIALTLNIEKGQVLTFDNGAEFIATSKSLTDDLTITGIIRKGNIISGSASPVIVNHTSSSLTITAKGDLETVTKQTDLNIAPTNKNLEVAALPQDLFKGEAFKFSGGGIIVLTENAYAKDTGLTGNVFEKIIASGETAQITDYRELKTRQITASGNLLTGQPNTFKGLSGFSRVGGKLGAPEILTTAGTIKQALLYKVFKQGYVTYAGEDYYGENVTYGDGSSFTASNGSSVREVIDPYDIKVGDTVYAYGAAGGAYLFQYSKCAGCDDGNCGQYTNFVDCDYEGGAWSDNYLTNTAPNNSVTWTDEMSGLKVHKIPYEKNAGQFDANQPTVCSSKIYGIEPGVTYTVGSSDFLSNGNERRAVVKYVKDTGSCKMRNGDPLQSSKYNKRNDCLRRDILTIDFDGNDDQVEQSWEDEKIEYGDYKTNGVKFRVTADFPAHYTDNIILKANDVLKFSKGGRFVLSQDIDLDVLVLVEDEEGENRYYGTMYGVIPFDCFLYHHEYAAVLDWVGDAEDHYYTSDGNTFSENATERIYVHNHQLEDDVVYRVEEGVQIRYNGANYSLGDPLTGADGVDFWEYTDLSNEFEYVTRAGKTETEFVGVAGRPFVEIAEGNPKIYVKGEGPLSDGTYVIEGDDPVYYNKEYTPTSNSIINSYYDKYFDCSAYTPTSFAPKSEAYLAGPYTEGILTTETNTYFEVSNAVPLNNGSWLYDTESLGAYVNLKEDYPKRENYANATGIAEAQDFIDVSIGSYETVGAENAWEIENNTDNNYIVAEGFLEFLHNKSSVLFPEVNANGLGYKEENVSVLFDVSSDGFYTQKEGAEAPSNEVPVTGAVFGAGDFAIHHWDETAEVLHETVIYKGYGNLSHAGNSTQGKSVSQGSIEEGYMYRVSDDSTDLKYKDKLIIINNEVGYSSVNMDGDQVLFEKYQDGCKDCETPIEELLFNGTELKNENVFIGGDISGEPQLIVIPRIWRKLVKYGWEGQSESYHNAVGGLRDITNWLAEKIDSDIHNNLAYQLTQQRKAPAFRDSGMNSSLPGSLNAMILSWKAHVVGVFNALFSLTNIADDYDTLKSFATSIRGELRVMLYDNPESGDVILSNKGQAFLVLLSRMLLEDSFFLEITKREFKLCTDYDNRNDCVTLGNGIWFEGVQTDSFENDLYHLIKVERKGWEENDFNINDALIFESLITSSAAYAQGDYTKNSANSSGISVANIGDNLLEGEILFFETSETVTSVVAEEYYCVTSGTVSCNAFDYGPNNISKVFKAFESGAITIPEGASVVKASVLKLIEAARSGSDVLYGEISQANLEEGAKCYREVAVLLSQIVESEDVVLQGMISDPLFFIIADDSLKIRSLSHGQMISKAFDSDFAEKGVYSEYSETERFKGVQSTPSWRDESSSAQVEYSNLMDVRSDFFKGARLLESDDDNDGILTFSKNNDLKGEYLSGQPKVLYKMNSSSLLDENGSFDIRYYLYDLDYGDSDRGLLTIGSSTTQGKNNFFIGDGNAAAATIVIDNLLSVKDNDSKDIKSFVYVYKAVSSGDIVSGREYLVYGTGSIEYEGVTINSSLDFKRISFEGGSSTDYEEKAFTRKSWDRTVTNTEWQLNASVPLNESKFYVARPVVYEKIYAGDENFSLTTEAGAIYYVFGEGSITYKSKKIYATNKYIAVASDSTTNKLIASGDIAYGGRMISTLGDQYNLSEGLGIVSPISPVRVWTYAAYMSAVGRREPSLSNIADKVYLYRKIHGSEALEINKKYFIFGAYDHVSYKIGSNDYDYYPRGVGRADVTVKGSSALTVSGNPLKTVTVDAEDAGANDFSTISAGSEIWITWTDASDTVHQTPRTVTNKASDTEVTIDSILPEIGGSIQATWSGKTDGATTGKTSVAGTFGTNVSVGVITRILLKRASIVKKGLGCCIYVRTEWLSPSNSSVILRHKKYTYSGVFGFADETKIPDGHYYVVRGRGSVIYPVYVHASVPEGDYTLVSGESNIYKHDNLSREYESGEVFSALEHPDYIGGNTVTNSSHFYKNTGQERVYRLPKDYKRREEEINSMDQFIDMAPPKYGVKSGQLLHGYTYKVSYIDPDSGDVFSGDWWAEKYGDAGITYAGKLYTVGQTFVCVSVKDGSQQLQKGDMLTGTTIKGGERVIREFSGNPNCIVRPIDGIRKCSTKGEWSNEWSMFITTTHHHPSRTSTWHHDYYGDVMGFLNNRCHIFSEDFKLGMYKHLLDTFSYGIKPVIRSEAPPGHMYLEGSNASQEWFYSEVEENQLNEWFYSSCQVYKPDYKIDSVEHIDYTNLYDETNFNFNDGEFRIERKGVCIDCKILSKGSCLDENGDGPVDGNGDPFEDQDSCVQAGHEWHSEAGKDCSKKNRKECDAAGGKWIELKDRIRVTLDRRLSRTPDTAFTGIYPAGHAHAPEQESGKKISDLDNDELMDLHHAMGSGPFTPEVYRTDENSVVEYLIREKYVDRRDRPDFETPAGKLISGEPLQVQCNKAKIGDSAPDVFIWRLPDDPFGACEPRFYFTKHIPYVYDDNQGQGTMWIKTPVTIDPFVQMEMYLRGFCGGFIDKESDPQHEEITEVEDKYGDMKTLDPTCYKSKDYDYLFENLAIQSIDDEGPNNGFCSDGSHTNRYDCESNGACLDVSGEFSPLDEDQNPYEDQASCIQAGHVWHSTNTWKQYENYKTIFKNIRDVEILKERILTVERSVKLPLGFVKYNLFVSGVRAWVIYRFDPDSNEYIIDSDFKRRSVVKAGTVRFKYRKYCVGNCASVDPNTRSYAYIDLGTPTVFVDRYEEKLDGRNTLSYDKMYYIVAVGRDMKTALRYNDTKRVVSSERWTTEADMLVVEDSQSMAEISFTPSYCSDSKYKTKDDCEEFKEYTLGTNPISINAWMPAKYFTIERKRTLLPHYTEWRDSPREIAPRTEWFRQNKKNKKLNSDQLPEFQFQIPDIDVSTAEEDDPVYSGVTKEYEIRVLAYYKRKGSGTCSDLSYATEQDCVGAVHYWTPTPISTDETMDEFERVLEIPAYGLKKNPFLVTSDSAKFNSGNDYGALLIGSADGSLNIRFIYYKLQPPIDRNTKKPITGLEEEVVGTYVVGLTLKPIKAPKLFYEVQYRVKYSYTANDRGTSSVRREEWEVVKRYQDIDNEKEITYIDTNRYENQNVNYRIMKAQSRAGGSRWISPLMLVDELTDYPDDRKGFGPLPNIRLRAYVFNQFANAINLLNEARLDLPITIRYRYHILGVAKPCSTRPKEGLHSWGYELNEPAPTTGSYCVSEYCRHAVGVSLNPTQDRYEQITPGWGGEHSIIQNWTDPEGEMSVSGWYTTAGHAEFSADREYGFRRWPLMNSPVDASIALGGTRVDTELSVNGEQLAFSFAVPDLLKSRASTDGLILSGRMDQWNMWHPTMRGVDASYWEARDKGVDSSDWPEYCGYSDSTGFFIRAFTAYGFYQMGDVEGSEGKWVVFDREETSKTWCQDIKGTFTMKAPELKTSFGGIIISHQQSGARNLNTCTFGGSQSSLIFTTRASTGDNNMRIEIPVKDKLGSWPICSFFAYKNTEIITAPDPEVPEPEEDVETADTSEDGAAGAGEGRG